MNRKRKRKQEPNDPLSPKAPPRLANFLLYLVVPKKAREELLGDLAEGYHTVQAKFGSRFAGFWYWNETVRTVAAIAIPIKTHEEKPRTNAVTCDPPNGAEYLLFLLLPRERQEDVSGDLREKYQKAFHRYGDRRAMVWYYKEVCVSLWPVLRTAIRRLVGLLAVSHYGPLLLGIAAALLIALYRLLMTFIAR